MEKVVILHVTHGTVIIMLYQIVMVFDECFLVINIAFYYDSNLYLSVARVLVGNTTQGNCTMRVPPTGYDTTGDGNSIFGMVTFTCWINLIFN